MRRARIEYDDAVEEVKREAVERRIEIAKTLADALKDVKISQAEKLALERQHQLDLIAAKEQEQADLL
jgi:hypothetical protein